MSAQTSIRSAWLAVLLAAGAAQAAEKLPPPDPRLDTAACRRLSTGPGPHSLLFLPDSARLLISSHDRRHFESTGDIQEYNTQDGRLRTLMRRGEPADLQFRPHHMAVQEKQGETLLWIINHDTDSPNSRHHSVLVYALGPDGLVFRQRLRDALLSSPNHIAVAGNGDVYVSNDRQNGSSVLELALRQSKANLVLWQAGRGWKIVADELSFPNGVIAEEKRVLTVLSFGNALLEFPRHSDGSLGPARKILTLPALDSFGRSPDAGHYLVVSHGPLLDFLRHKSNSRHHSASIIYNINADTGQVRPFFSDDGSRISAMSHALVAGHALYIGQSFDSFVLKCPLR